MRGSEYPQYNRANMQKTRDNASRFKRELEINELLLVKNRNEVVNHQDYKQTNTRTHCKSKL